MDSVGLRLAEKSRGSSRQVRLTLRYVSVWSATRIAFLCGVGLGIVGGLSVILLWMTLTALGVFGQLSSLFDSSTVGGSSTSTFGFAQAVGVAAIFWPLDAIGATLIGAVGAALYNLTVRLTGGVTVGFSSE
jgi:hypothetical protein